MFLFIIKYHFMLLGDWGHIHSLHKAYPFVMEKKIEGSEEYKQLNNDSFLNFMLLICGIVDTRFYL